MRTWLVVANVVGLLAGCGDKGDRCQRFVDRSRRVLEPMLADAGKPAPPDLFAELLAGCRDASADDRTAIDCVVNAADQAGVAACWQAEFAEYGGLGPIRQLRAELGRAGRRAGRAAELRPDAAPIDAAPIDAAPAPRTWPAAIDPATLPQLVAPGLDPTAPAPVELVVVDLPAGRVLTTLRPDRPPLLARPSEQLVRARVRARDRAGAYALLAEHLGYAPAAPRLRGGGTPVDLRFADAPVRDLLRLFADVLRRNVVASPGDLGAVDIVVRRAPASALLSSLLVLVERRASSVGNMVYVVPAAATLPALPTLPAAAGPRLDRLALAGASAAEAMVALRAVSGADLGVRLPCGGPPLQLWLRDLPLAEAVRALSVASGLAIEAGPAAPCEPAPTAPGADLIGLRVVARRGTVGAAVAVTASGQAQVVLASADPPVQVLETSLQLADRTVGLALPPLATRSLGLPGDDAHLVRTAGVLIERGAAQAWVAYDDGTFLEARAGLGYDGRRVEVGVAAVTVTQADTDRPDPRDPNRRFLVAGETFTVPLAAAP